MSDEANYSIQQLQLRKLLIDMGCDKLNIVPTTMAEENLLSQGVKALRWRTRENPFEWYTKFLKTFHEFNELVKVIHVQQGSHIMEFYVHGKSGEEMDYNFVAEIETDFFFELK